MYFHVEMICHKIFREFLLKNLYISQLPSISLKFSCIKILFEFDDRKILFLIEQKKKVYIKKIVNSRWQMRSSHRIILLYSLTCTYTPNEHQLDTLISL